MNLTTKSFLLLVVPSILLAGCAQENTCALARVAGSHVEIVSACQAEYQNNGNTEALTGWVTALSEKGDFEAIDNVLLSLDSEGHRAGAMVAAARAHLRGEHSDRAMNYYVQAAKIFKQLELPAAQADSLHRAARISWRTSDYRTAIEFATESLSAAKTANEPNAEIAALQTLFVVFHDVENLSLAQYALDLVKLKLNEKSSVGAKVNTFINQGLLHMMRGQYGMAAHNFDLGIKAAEGSNNRNGLRGLFLNAADANIKLQQLSQAEEYMQTAWSYANPDGTALFALFLYHSQLHYQNHDYQLAKEAITKALEQPDTPSILRWDMHYWAGKIAQALGDREQTILAYQRSIAAMEGVREDVAYDELKSHLLTRKRKAYEALFIEYLQSGQNSKAFEIAEQAKTRSFIDSLVRSGEGSTALLSAQQSMFAAEADRIDKLQAYLKSMGASPILADMDAEQALAMLKGKHTISYFIAERRLFIIVVSDGSVNIMEATINYAELTDLVLQYKRHPNQLVTLDKLGAYLLPSKVLPPPGTHLFIAPDGVVSGLAISSFRVNSQYLVERNSVSLVPSATALVRISKYAPRVSINKTFTIMADPLDDLPAAKQEALEIAKLLNSKAITGNSASFESVLRNTKSNVLHVASHSGISNLGPWIRFADRHVSGIEIITRGLQADLAVLASCASAANQDGYLWGSLGGLFLSGGTPTVVAALWSVDDEITFKIMQNFYQHYLTGSSASESLAYAQKNAIAEGVDASAWGAFVVMGMPGFGL